MTIIHSGRIVVPTLSMPLQLFSACTSEYIICIIRDASAHLIVFVLQTMSNHFVLVE